MEKYFTILFFLTLFTSALNAQNITLTGKVVTSRNEPLEGVNIVLLGTNFGDATNSDGIFEIKSVPIGDYTLQASLIGYGKKIYSITKTNYSRFIKIFLSEITLQTDQVIVSAAKHLQNKIDLSVSTAVISPEILSNRNYQTFDEMLRTVAGVQVNLEQVSIRGSSGYTKGAGTRVLVAINGIPFYSGDSGDIVWEIIPVTDIERVEVIKGPASSLYGSSAIGGVINIITKSFAKYPITQFQSYFGMYDKPSYDIWDWSESSRNFYGLAFTHSNSVSDLSYTFSAKKFDNDGYRQNNYFKRNLLYLNLNYKVNDQSRISFFTNYLNMNRGNFLYWKDSRNALVPKDEDNGNYVKSDRLFSGFTYQNNISKTTTLDIKASNYYTKFTGIGLEVTTSTANLSRLEAILNSNLTNSMDNTSGIEASYTSVKSNIFKNPTFFGAGVFTNFDYKFSKSFSANFGMRFDYMKLDTIDGASAITPKAGLNYKLSDQIIMRGSVGTGFRAPTPSEVFTTAGVGGGIDVKENPNLKPEKSVSLELGSLIIISDQINIDAALYQTEYDQFIEPLLTREGKIQFTNITNARIQGAEIIADWQIIPQTISVNFGYNYMWARDVDNNIAMKYRPRHTINTSADLNFYPFSFNFNFRYLSKVEQIDFNLTQPPFALIVDGSKRVPVFVTDFSAIYNFFVSTYPVKIQLNVKNLFNYNYVEFMGNIAPLRNYSIGTEIFF